MREIRTSGSVGAPGEQSPGATRPKDRRPQRPPTPKTATKTASAQENAPAPSALPTADSGSAISSSEVRSALTPKSATTTTVTSSSAAANRFP